MSIQLTVVQLSLCNQSFLQGMNFIKNLLYYISIDKDTSQISVKKFCGHLWYLSVDICALASFDETIYGD